MDNELMYMVYWRKSNRHHWVFTGMALLHDKYGLFREVYLSQQADGWQVGYTTEVYIGEYPINKPANYPMIIPPRITPEMKRAVLLFLDFGITPINSQIIGAFVARGLLKDSEV